MKSASKGAEPQEDVPMYNGAWVSRALTSPKPIEKKISSRKASSKMGHNKDLEDVKVPAVDFEINL